MSNSRLAVCSWSLQPANPAELVRLLASLDLPRVQLALSPVMNDRENWGDTVEILWAEGIRIISGMMEMASEDYSTLKTIAETGGVRPDATWPANRQHAEAVADLAADHGIRLVTFHAGFLPEDAGDPERGKLIDRLRQVADLFAARGLELALETGQETADTLMEALDEIDRPNVGINFDPANMILYGKGDPVEALKKLAPRVKQIHIKDAVPTTEPGTWGAETPAGQGAVAWPAFFEVALTIDPPVNFVIEREGGDDRLGDIAAAAGLANAFLTDQ
ncbi:MAG: sugar phosphate isomerase/epimerase [Phycisphaerales bacterium]|nr:MAG: sugar phosphate isomerase/epimerase [Phycisphaerales bacterium]